MIENGVRSHANVGFEKIMDKTMKEKIMKYGNHQTIINAEWCYEVAFNIVVMLEQSSNCNNILKEQTDTRKYTQSTQSKMISEEHVLKPRLREKDNEHVPNVLDDNKVIAESKEKKEEIWITY